jgi:hypothetical protein
MSYIKKTASINEGDTVGDLYTFLTDNYTTAADLIMGDYVGYTQNGLEDINFSPNAGIHESKISDGIDRHHHLCKYNLGEGVIGDRQLSWEDFAGVRDPEGRPPLKAGVMLIRGFRPGLQIVAGVTPPVALHGQSALASGDPPNVVQRVNFASVLGSTSPFTPGSVVHILVTPHVPVYLSSEAAADKFFTGVEYLVVGVDYKGFDLWVCTKDISRATYFFNYVAIGWSVI